MPGWQQLDQLHSDSEIPVASPNCTKAFNHRALTLELGDPPAITVKVGNNSKPRSRCAQPASTPGVALPARSFLCEFDALYSSTACARMILHMCVSQRLQPLRAQRLKLTVLCPSLVSYLGTESMRHIMQDSACKSVLVPMHSPSDCDRESRQALRTLHQNAEASCHSDASTSPITRSASAAFRETAACESAPTLTSPLKSL